MCCSKNDFSFCLKGWIFSKFFKRSGELIVHFYPHIVYTFILTKNSSEKSVLLLCVFFWVIPRRLNFICRRFGTLCLFHLHRSVGVEFYTYLPMKMEQTGCSETSAYKIQTPGNYPEENIQHTEHGKSLKSRICTFAMYYYYYYHHHHHHHS